MVVFDSCGCCSLQIGALLIAVALTIVSFTLTTLVIYILALPDMEVFLESFWKKLFFFNGGSVMVGQNSTLGPLPLNLTSGQVLSIEFGLLMLAVYLGVCWLSNFLLIIGAAKKTTALMVQWMAVQWISLLLYVVLIGLVLWRLILAGAVNRYWWVLVFGMAIFILLLLALLVVLSLYQSIRNREAPDVCRDDIELLPIGKFLNKFRDEDKLPHADDDSIGYNTFSN